MCLSEDFAAANGWSNQLPRGIGYIKNSGRLHCVYEIYFPAHGAGVANLSSHYILSLGICTISHKVGTLTILHVYIVDIRPLAIQILSVSYVSSILHLLISVVQHHQATLVSMLR